MSEDRESELAGFIDNAMFIGDSPKKIAEMCLILTELWDSKKVELIKADYELLKEVHIQHARIVIDRIDSVPESSVRGLLKQVASSSKNVLKLVGVNND